MKQLLVVVGLLFLRECMLVSAQEDGAVKQFAHECCRAAEQGDASRLTALLVVHGQCAVCNQVRAVAGPDLFKTAAAFEPDDLDVEHDDPPSPLVVPLQPAPAGMLPVRSASNGLGSDASDPESETDAPRPTLSLPYHASSGSGGALDKDDDSDDDSSYESGDGLVKAFGLFGPLHLEGAPVRLPPSPSDVPLHWD